MTRAPHVAVAALAVLATAACHMPPAPSPEPGGRPMPVLKLSEDEDEWLHDHCAYRGIGQGLAGSQTGETKAGDANLGEVVYEHDGVADLALFACRSMPPFLVSGLLAPPPIAGAEPAPPLPTPPTQATAARPVPSIAPVPVAPPTPTVTPTAPPPPQPPPPKTVRPLAPYGTAAVVAGAVGLGAGVVTGVLAMNAASDVHAHCDANRVCDGQGLDAAAKGPALATASTACFVGGGVLAAAGILLFALPGTAVKAAPASQGLGLSLQGAF